MKSTFLNFQQENNQMLVYGEPGTFKQEQLLKCLVNYM